MAHSNLHYTSILLSAAGALAGCSATTSMPALPQSSRLAVSQGQHRAIKSWAAAGLGPQDLLYVGNANGLVNVYRYWQKNLVSVLTNFTTPMGMCVDNNRNVYITDFGAKTIAEYRHGGSTAVRTIDDAPYAPYGCAVDPTTGNLAVANYDKPATSSYNNNSGNIAIYKHAKGKPVLWGNKKGRFTTLSYDDHGDLLATDLNFYYYSFFSTTYFYYLPKHGAQLLQMNLPNPYSTSSYGWRPVQSINYDGTYWVVTAGNTMLRYTIGVKAQEVDAMPLIGASGAVGEIWLYRKTLKAQAIQVVAGDDVYNKSNLVDYWKYPVSGDPVATISNGLDGPYGLTISLRTSK
jgi:hypothetical protein